MGSEMCIRDSNILCGDGSNTAQVDDDISKELGLEGEQVKDSDDVYGQANIEVFRMENELEVCNPGPKQVDERSIAFGDAVASLLCLLSSTSGETFVEVLVLRPNGLFLERLRCLSEKVIPIRCALNPHMAFKREGIGVFAKIPAVGNRFVSSNTHPKGEYLSGLWLG